MNFLLGIKNWLIGIAAVIAMLAAAVFLGRSKGKAVQKAKQDTANAEQRVQDIVLRTQIEEKNAELPPAPPQTVATADPKTAAGKLRDEGWLR